MRKIAILAALMLVAGMTFAQSPETAADQPAAQADILKLIEGETNIGTLFQVVVSAREKNDYPVMEKAATRLVELRPHVPDFAMLLARTFALQSKMTEAYNVLMLVEREGVYFDIETDQDLENVSDSEVFRYLVHSFGLNNEPTGTPLQETILKRADLLADSIAWDSNAQTMLVGSVTNGAVYRVQKDGSLEALVEANQENALLGVFDIAVDAERDILWVSSNAVAHFKDVKFADNGRSGIWKFRLSTGEYLTRLETPKNGAYLLNDIAVAADGTLYIANGRQPEILTVDPDAKELRRFIAAPDLTSIRALGLTPDGLQLYFSDYELGLYRVDIAARKTIAVVGLDSMNLGGIDDILISPKYVMVIQNGGLPNRLVRLEIDARGQVSKANSLLSGLPQFQSPSTGVVVDQRLHLLSASHWNLYDQKSGLPREGVSLTAPSILTADIGFAPAAPERLFDPEEALERAKAARRN